jgi:hypothetical protein
MTENDIAFQAIADKWLAPYFDSMPPVPLTVGKPESFRNGAIAHYRFETRTIELHPFWADDGTNFGRIKTSIKHELVHAWVHWKGLKGSILKDKECNHHNEYFLWKSRQLGIDVNYLFTKYPQTLPVWEKIKAGWEPSIKSSKKVSNKGSLIEEIRNRPRILSVKPEKIYVKTGVTVFLQGRNLNNITSVFVGGIPVKFRIESSGLITFTSPTYKPGLVDVVVDNGVSPAACTITYM